MHILDVYTNSRISQIVIANMLEPIDWEKHMTGPPIPVFPLIKDDVNVVLPITPRWQAASQSLKERVWMDKGLTIPENHIIKEIRKGVLEYINGYPHVTYMLTYEESNA